MLRRFALALGLVTMLGSAAYLFLYLSRWEWNRALIAGLVLVAVETAVFSGLLYLRLERLEHRLDAGATAPSASGGSASGSVIVADLRASRPQPDRPYAWLAPPDRLGVFIPLLLGTGMVLSALAWLVERVARLTVGRAAEYAIARRLTELGLPDALVGQVGAEDPTGLLHPGTGWAG